MMQKRKLSSLLLISFIVVFACSYAMANNVTFETKANAPRCADGFQNITVNPTEEITGFEIVFEIQSTSGGAFVDPVTVNWGAGVPTGWYKTIDYRVDGVAPDTIRIAALRLDPGLSTLVAGSYDVATVAYTTNDVCTGEVTVKGASWSGYPNPTGPIVTQFTDLSGQLVSAAVTAGKITIANQAPTLAAITSQTTHWGANFTVTAVGADDDLPNGCETLTYSLLSGAPAGMTINASTGKIDWSVPGTAVGNNTVNVKVTDACNGVAQRTFTICVENDAPVITCPANQVVAWGEAATGTITATDPDGGPNALAYGMVSFDGPGSFTVNPTTGEYTWQTLTTSDYTGVFHACVKVTDNANVDACSPANADTCCFEIEVIPHQVKIAKVHNVIQGQMYDVDLTMLDDSYVNSPMGGFEFLIQYDASALTLMGVSPGTMLTECGWEYFTYRTGPWGECGTGCPSGMVQIVGIAEYNNGGTHPACFTNDGVNTHSPQLAVMRFLVSNDRTLECQFVPIRFTWIDCTNNTISNVAGDVLYISGEVWDYVGDNGVDTYTEITDFNPTPLFPTIYGAPDYCDEFEYKGTPYRFIKFINGGIDIICSKDIDARGDINLDGVAYSIADAVMFSNYFIYGLNAFQTHTDGSIAASDVNADGLTLTVADLVYLIRVVVGDAQPVAEGFLKEVASVNSNVSYSKDGVYSVNGINLGAAHFVIEGNVTPTLLASDVDMQYSSDGKVTNVLVRMPIDRSSEGFTGDFIRLDGKVISVELATADGSPVNSNLVPSEFALNQNYPNPFNPETKISFSLAKTSDYRLAVYNVAGQLVKVFNGHADAGVVEITWDASQNASGVYFYKLTAGNFTDTKKMVLLK